MKIQCKCGAGYQVKPEMAGRKVKCKRCDATFTVPKPESAAASVVGSTPSNPPGHSPPAQKAPPSFQKTMKTPEQAKREREEAVLAGYTSKPAKKSLDERIADRHAESIERDRSTNSIKYIIIGLLCIAAGVGTYFIFAALDDGGVAPVVVWALKLIGGKYWIPPLLGLIGIWQIAIGVLSLFKVVDIDDDEQLPTSF